jgi:hypothetical protein
MASQFGFSSQMMLFADANRRMLSHALMPVGEVLNKLQEINDGLKGLKSQGINIQGTTITQPTIPTIPADLAADADAFNTIYQQVVVQKNAFPISLISKHDEWTAKKDKYTKFLTAKAAAEKQMETFKAAKFYMNQTVKQDQLLKYYEERMTTFPFEIEYASPLMVIYKGMALDPNDNASKESPLMGTLKTAKPAAIQTQYIANIKKNLGKIITAFGQMISDTGEAVAPKDLKGVAKSSTPLPAADSDLIQFLLKNNIYKITKQLKGVTDETKIDAALTGITYDFDIKPLVMVLHGVLRMNLGIVELMEQATNSGNQNWNALALGQKLTGMKKAIVQYKKATSSDEIKAGKQGLINAYQGVLTTIDLNMVTVEKKIDSSKMSIKNPIEIKGDTIINQFGIEKTSIAGKLLSVDVTIEQFEYDFDDKSMAVEVLTKPQDNFILNEYPDVFYLNYVKVKYIRDGTTTTPVKKVS